MEHGCKFKKENMYMAARKEAAKYNDRLNSREYASELIGCSTSTLSDYELGLTKIVPPDRVCKMAELYSAPELRNKYCMNDCPIGKYHNLSVETECIDRLTLKLIKNLRPSFIEALKEDLIMIAEDGVIDYEEKQTFDDCILALGELRKTIDELRLLAEKLSYQSKAKIRKD